MTAVRPLDVLLTRKTRDVLADGVVTAAEVNDVARLARASDRSTTTASAPVAAFVAAAAGRFESSQAEAQARALVDVAAAPMPRPDNGVVRYVAPQNDNAIRSHQLYIQRNGVVDGNTGLSSYSRGWGQFNVGVLNKANGSSVPSSAIHDLSTRAALNASSPAARLDAAAQAFGVKFPMNDFRQIAQGFHRPDQPDWAGVCYAWSWAALDARLSSLVDVDGPQGERGLWIGGQFLSRADLGNWLMALSAGLSQGAGDVLWYAPEGEDLLKATLGYLLEGGSGFRADIGNSFPGDRGSEIWFQPFTGAKAEFASVPSSTEQGILDVARQPRKAGWGGTTPGVDGASVKLVTLTGRYGNEKEDNWEGRPEISEMTWSVYAVLDKDGKLLKGIMADDPRIASVPGLPVTTTNPVPRELFAPEHSIVDGILAGTPAPEVQGSVYGPALDFFVGHVLARGVPAPLRKAFEKDAGTGPLSSTQVADLQQRYPTIANAYAPQEWATKFAARGLDAAAFGAAEYAAR
jgi:hypothetical protein